MLELRFEHPPIVEYGCGSILKLSTHMLESCCKRILILCDKAVIKCAGLTELVSSLKETDHKVLQMPHHEPTYDDLNFVLQHANQFQPDGVVGIGGGSTLDTAKLVSALVNKDIDIIDIINNSKVVKRSVGLYQIPTTSGTGSEATIRAIISDPQTFNKKAVESTDLMADAVFLDPQLTVTVSPFITAATGMDALIHCIEAYTNKNSHPIIDMYALKGASLISQNIQTAVSNGSQIDAREALMLGSFYGGLCLGPVNTAAVHALAYPLGSQFKIPHGIANALLLPYVMSFNSHACEDKMIQLANIFLPGQSSHTPNMAVEYIKKLCNTVGVSRKMREFGVTNKDISGMAESALKITRLLNNNPQPLAYDDAIRIYELAF